MNQSEEKNTSDFKDLQSDLHSKIENWKKQYGDIYQIEVDDPEECPELANQKIICRQPGRVALSRFVKDAATGDALKAQNNFFFSCLLYPDPEVIKKAGDKKPGIVIALGNKLQELTGANQNFTMKKL